MMDLGECLDPELLRAMARSKDPHIRASAAEHPHVDRDDLARLADDPDPLVRAGVTAQVTLPNEIWHKLARDAVHSVRLMLASNSAFTDSRLVAMAEDSYIDLRLAIAQLTCHAEVLEVFAKDLDPEVRAAVAANKHTGDRVRQLLAQDQDWTVRIAVLAHADPELREKLAHDEHPVVRARAQGIAAEIAAEEAEAQRHA